MYSVEDKIRWIAATANAVVSDLKVAPEKYSMTDLISTCALINEKYQKLCEKQDTKNNLELGTTYKNKSLTGNIKVTVAEWHIISMALQKIDIKRNEY